MRILLTFLRANWQSFVAAVAAGVFLTTVGAFGTERVALGLRLTYWVPMMVLGTVAGTLIAARTRRRPRLGENPVLLWVIVTAAVTVPGTFLVWGYTVLVFGTEFGRSLPRLLLEVGFVTGAASALMMAINRPGPMTRAAVAIPGTPAAPARFNDRLPAKLRDGLLYALQAEDHYLRLHTSKGSDLILMRLSDAIAELDGVEGAQVHRSWWVAKAAITDVKRAGRRVTLVLADGTEAPVSRPNAVALRQSGWIA